MSAFSVKSSSYALPSLPLPLCCYLSKYLRWSSAESQLLFQTPPYQCLHNTPVISMGTGLGMAAGWRRSTSMWHTLSKQMARSEPHLPEGARSKVEANWLGGERLEVLQKFPESFLKFWSSPPVQSPRRCQTNRKGESLNWSFLLFKKKIHLRLMN